MVSKVPRSDVCEFFADSFKPRNKIYDANNYFFLSWNISAVLSQLTPHINGVERGGGGAEGQQILGKNDFLSSLFTCCFSKCEFSNFLWYLRTFLGILFHNISNIHTPLVLIAASCKTLRLRYTMKRKSWWSKYDMEPLQGYFHNSRETNRDRRKLKHT